MPPIVRGIFPINWFQDKFKVPNVERFMIPSRICPHKLLLERSIKLTMGNMLSDSITYPFTTSSMRLEYEVRDLSFSMSNRVTEVKAVKLPKHCGMDPDNLLSARSKCGAQKANTIAQEYLLSTCCLLDAVAPMMTFFHQSIWVSHLKICYFQDRGSTTLCRFVN